MLAPFILLSSPTGSCGPKPRAGQLGELAMGSQLAVYGACGVRGEQHVADSLIINHHVDDVVAVAAARDCAADEGYQGQRRNRWAL